MIYGNKTYNQMHVNKSKSGEYVIDTIGHWLPSYKVGNALFTTADE